jgi:hypothetical protein
MSPGKETTLFATASKKSLVNCDNWSDWIDGFPIFAPNPMKKQPFVGLASDYIALFSLTGR